MLNKEIQYNFSNNWLRPLILIVFCNNQTNVLYFRATTIQDKLSLSCELADNRKSSISAFQEISTSTDNSFTLGGGLSTNQLFYEVLRFSWDFQIS